jgi:hypothetical protein
VAAKLIQVVIDQTCGQVPLAAIEQFLHNGKLICDL